MSKIRIKNFGPIKEGYSEHEGWIDFKKVTVFIGNQGSGKSTVAKVFSTLSWLEKALNRGDYKKGAMSHVMFYELFNYQRIRNYFNADTEIEYEGETAIIKYNKRLDYPLIKLKSNSRFNVPKIMYVPSERNFLSTVEDAFGITNLPGALFTFAEELRKGQYALNGKILPLPIGDVKYKFIKESETSWIFGDNFELDILESSSGYQSYIPLYLVSKFLSEGLLKSEDALRSQLTVEQSVRRSKEISEVMFDSSLTESEKKKRVLEIDAKFLNTCFINIVEEPEQNLFPSSQRQILNSLLEINNLKEGNKLIMTTHSPYLINFLSIAIQGKYLEEKINSIKGSSITASKFGLNENPLEKLYQILPGDSLVPSSDVIIYQLNELDGTITKLPSPEGIPSDKNYLNQSIAEGNSLFDSLLKLEEEL